MTLLDFSGYLHTICNTLHCQVATMPIFLVDRTSIFWYYVLKQKLWINSLEYRMFVIDATYIRYVNVNIKRHNTTHSFNKSRCFSIWIWSKIFNNSLMVLVIYKRRSWSLDCLWTTISTHIKRFKLFINVKIFIIRRALWLLFMQWFKITLQDITI